MDPAESEVIFLRLTRERVCFLQLLGLVPRRDTGQTRVSAWEHHHSQHQSSHSPPVPRGEKGGSALSIRLGTPLDGDGGESGVRTVCPALTVSFRYFECCNTMELSSLGLFVLFSQRDFSGLGFGPGSD